MITLSTLTREQFLTVTSAFIGKREVTRLNALPTYAYERLETALLKVKRYLATIPAESKTPVLELAYRNTCEGIIWAISSGRVNGYTAITIRAMNVKELLELVYDVKEHCSVYGDVPARLIRYCHKEEISA